MAEVQTVAVDLPPEAISYLSDQARKRGITPTEALISALGTDQYVREKAGAADSDIVVIEKGKSLKLAF